MRSRRVLGAVLIAASLAPLPGCGPSEDRREPVDRVSLPIAAPLPDAFCTIQVDGIGAVAAEDDYLPHVITCENGGANLQALKAQAIAARSVAYYSMSGSGSICDGQGCQVYSCGAQPQAKHIQAVKETAGMYLSYASMLTYGFYVAGDQNTAPPACVGSSGTTEKWVTYNEGKTGTAVEQTALGYIGPPGFGQNRGCMGQWGARCLENNNGYDYLKILQFYYGADIQILTAPGPCVQPTTPELDAKFVGQGSDAPADDQGKANFKICAGAPVNFWFEVENSGTASWTDAGGTAIGQAVRLGVPDDSNDPLVGKNRISVSENGNPDVQSAGGDCSDQPGCKRTVFSTGASSPATAPTTPGVVTTRWRLVDEGHAWFGPEMYLAFNVVDCGSADGGGTGAASGGGGTGATAGGGTGAAAGVGGAGAGSGTGGAGGGQQSDVVGGPVEGGCGCRLAASRTGGWHAAALVFALGGLCAGRRRRRRA